MKGFSQELVMKMHRLLTEKSGGDPNIRDTGLLDSALSQAYATFGGVELYPTTEDKAARLGFALISNHAFVDGNKRIGMLVMLTFLAVNGRELRFTSDELTEIALAVASGRMGYDELLDRIKNA